MSNDVTSTRLLPRPPSVPSRHRTLASPLPSVRTCSRNDRLDPPTGVSRPSLRVTSNVTTLPTNRAPWPSVG
jgi:hypothetical protein